MTQNFKLASIIMSLFLLSCTHYEITKPEVFVFGDDIETVKQNISKYCSSITEENISPIQLPTAKQSQIQLNCKGFEFAGKKRDVELVFADNALDLVWILTEAEEEQKFIETYTELYGEPTHKLKEATFYLNDGVAVRNKPHEVLFLSERLKAPYKQWLSMQE